jgi:hypothetical protein
MQEETTDTNSKIIKEKLVKINALVKELQKWEKDHPIQSFFVSSTSSKARAQLLILRKAAGERGQQNYYGSGHSMGGPPPTVEVFPPLNTIKTTGDSLCKINDLFKGNIPPLDVLIENLNKSVIKITEKKQKSSLFQRAAKAVSGWFTSAPAKTSSLPQNLIVSPSSQKDTVLPLPIPKVQPQEISAPKKPTLSSKRPYNKKIPSTQKSVSLESNNDHNPSPVKAQTNKTQETKVKHKKNPNPEQKNSRAMPEHKPRVLVKIDNSSQITSVRTQVKKLDKNPKPSSQNQTSNVKSNPANEAPYSSAPDSSFVQEKQKTGEENSVNHSLVTSSQLGRPLPAKQLENNANEKKLTVLLIPKIKIPKTEKDKKDADNVSRAETSLSFTAKPKKSPEKTKHSNAASSKVKEKQPNSSTKKYKPQVDANRKNPEISRSKPEIIVPAAPLTTAPHAALYNVNKSVSLSQRINNKLDDLLKEIKDKLPLTYNSGYIGFDGKGKNVEKVLVPAYENYKNSLLALKKEIDALKYVVNNNTNKINVPLTDLAHVELTYNGSRINMAVYNKGYSPGFRGNVKLSDKLKTLETRLKDISTNLKTAENKVEDLRPHFSWGIA